MKNNIFKNKKKEYLKIIPKKVRSQILKENIVILKTYQIQKMKQKIHKYKVMMISYLLINNQYKMKNKVFDNKAKVNRVVSFKKQIISVIIRNKEKIRQILSFHI